MLKDDFAKVARAKTLIRKAIQRRGTGLTVDNLFTEYPPYIDAIHIPVRTVDSTGLISYTEDYLTSFQVPANTDIRDYAFADWTNLQLVNIQGTEVAELKGTHAFDNTNLQYISVPANLVNAYKTAPNWSKFASKITGANYILNSDTMINQASTNSNANGCTFTKTFETDATAPVGTQLKVQMQNTATTNKGSTGIYMLAGTQLGTKTTAQLQEIMKVGQTYTYSFWAKADASNTATLTFVPSSVCESQTLVSHTCTALTTQWQRQTVTFTYKSNTKLTACFYVTIPASSTQTYYLCGLQLEPGSTANDYKSLNVSQPTNLIEIEETAGGRTVEWFNALTIENLTTDRR